MVKTPGMVVVRAPTGRNTVDVSQLGSDSLKEAAGESAAENVSHDLKSRIVLVLEDPAQMPDREKRLRDVVLGGEVNARRGLRGHLRERRRRWLTIGPVCKELLDPRLHLRRGKISAHRKHDVGRKEVALVESDQVLAADAVDVLILLAPAVRIVAAVNLLVERPLDDVIRLIIAPGNPAAKFVLGEIEFLLPELRRRQDIVEDGEHFVRVLLQGGEGNPPAALADVAFDRRGKVLELLVKLVARLARRASGAHDHSGHCRQTDLVLGIEQISGPHQRESVDKRQLVILEQVQFHAIGQRDLLDVRYFDFLERRKFQVFIRGDGRGHRCLREQQRGQRHQDS